MKLEKIFTALDFSEAETSAYLALLSYGTSSISRIARLADLNRGTAYVALHSLLDRGLVSKIMEGKVSHFSAQSPSVLRDIYERRLTALERSRQQVADTFSKISAPKDPMKEAPTIQYFRGIDGVIEAYKDLDRAETHLLRLFLSPVDGMEVIGPEKMNEFTQSRIDAGVFLQIIRPYPERRRKLDPRYRFSVKTSKKELREVRYLPRGLTFRAGQYIYDDKISMVTSEKEGYSVIIKSHEIAESQRILFDYVWGRLTYSAQ